MLSNRIDRIKKKLVYLYMCSFILTAILSIENEKINSIFIYLMLIT